MEKQFSRRENILSRFENILSRHENILSRRENCFVWPEKTFFLALPSFLQRGRRGFSSVVHEGGEIDADAAVKGVKRADSIEFRPSEGLDKDTDANVQVVAS